jgi:23S rRNA pseudouridine1911/1915/1917 synthase
MDRIETYIVPPNARRARADKVLAQAFPAHSRVTLQRAFDAGLVCRTGRPLAKSDLVRAGDAIEFSLPEIKAAGLKPVAIPLEILFEDEHLIALNKPAGMVVHPGIGTGEDTLVHALLAHCAGSLSGIGGVARPGIVHRLDRQTSGVLLVAKTDAAHRALAAQFAGRSLRKEYVALISGVPKFAAGVIDRPISRHPVHRHRMTAGQGGRAARTDWERLEVFGKSAAFVRCRIHTGRTHQIRAHFKAIGHPICGDREYGTRDRYGLQRQFLHAARLEFRQPFTGRSIEISSPLPEDLERALVAARSG